MAGIRTLFIALDEQTRWFDEGAAEKFDEDTYWDGNNRISRATGSQWDHETLYHTAKGRWVVLHISAWQGTPDTYTEIREAEALDWLLRQGHDVPEAFAAEREG